MYSLIRDNLPELLKQSKQQLNYAAIVNDEFFILALKQKMIEDVNSFLTSKETIDVNALVNIQTLIDSLVALSIEEKQFKKACEDKAEKEGTYSKRYIAVFDEIQKEEKSPEAE